VSEPVERAGPIGIFDSGVGGLTVAAALLRRFPNERILYVADQAHVPYGGRPLAEVHGFASGISDFLADEGCRAIVMACNVSSATALESVAAKLCPVPVLGVISAAARRIALSSARPRIGVLATEGTVRTGAYTAQIHALNPDAYVREVACPSFVPLVEMRETETDEAEDACLEYLRPLALDDCDTVVLGCTHYPYLLPRLRRAANILFSGDVTFVDPADEIAGAVQEAVPDVGWWTPTSPHLLLSTGDTDTFSMQVPGFLPGVECEIGGATWREGRLALENRMTAAA
jgi:glutamate racemase